jgi:hypothetical protein
MAEIKQYLYTNTGTEIDFIQGLVNIILELYPTATLEDANGDPTTVADQYTDLTSASKAEFYIRFGNVRLRMYRDATNNAAASAYRFSAITEGRVFYMYTGQKPTVSATRKYLITSVKSDNFFILWIGKYDDVSTSQAPASIMLIKQPNNNNFITSNNSATVLNEFRNGTISANYASMFGYSAGAGNLEYVEKAVFKSGEAKVFELEDLKSCTIVPAYSSLALPDGRLFYAVASNAMVEITEEE